MKKITLYTRTGDDGTTSLAGGTRISKCAPRIEAYGAVDELNAFLGLLAMALSDPDRHFVADIQRQLFVLGGALSIPPEKQMPEAFKIKQQSIDRMEEEIDRIDAQLPRLKSFTLPGGSKAAAYAHVCRTVCRRAEREVYRLAETDPVDTVVLCYINRLSDYLFILSRKLLYDARIDEIFLNND